jgi:hypothetical protein
VRTLFSLLTPIYICNDRYLIRIPKNWNDASGPRPILFIHGLGLGLFQYYIFLRHLLDVVTDRPVLVLLQPQISQDIFHPQFLKPPNRRQTIQKLTSLLTELGWVCQGPDGEDELKSHFLSAPKAGGITVLSHSKYVLNHLFGV